MAINITNLPGASPQVKTDKTEQQNVQRQQAATPQNASQQATQKQDSVSITPQAQQVSKLQQRATNSSGIDQEKVEKIRQAIADGKYKINVEQLARRIVQFEGELYGKH